MLIVFVSSLLFFILSFMILIGASRGVNKSRVVLYRDRRNNEIRESEK